MKKPVFLGMKHLILTLVGIFLLLQASGQVQFADTNYQPPILQPEYPDDNGPVIFIDEGHQNFHTAEGRYKPFAELLRRDGYKVIPYQGDFISEHLEQGKVLVISNALNPTNIGHWYLPTPSAFTEAEIETVVSWVKAGGSLFLIADHMPMAGAAADLASRFGFTFYNGFAGDTASQGPDLFTRSAGTLIENTITNGRNPDERVDSIVSFTGQSFDIPTEATSILNLGDDWVTYITDTAWVFNDQTEEIAAKGMSQGAYRKFGQGRVVVFGEAAMFSAQIAIVNDHSFMAGMNKPEAKYNHQLLLNIIHWLDGE